MKQKILMMTIAATLAAPMTVQADVKFSGAVQAEGGGYRHGRWLSEDADYIRTSKDGDGALLNGGPNALTFDFNETIGNIVAEARYNSAFSTAANSGLNGRDSWVGLRARDNSFNIRFGKLSGVYKSSKGYIDPFADTSLQARGTGGGMSGNGYNRIAGATLIVDHNGRATGVLVDKNDAPVVYSERAYAGGYLDKNGEVIVQTDGEWGEGVTTDRFGRVFLKGNLVDMGDLYYDNVEQHSAALMTSPNSKVSAGEYGYDNGLAHSGYVNNALQIGGGMNGFSVTFQGVFDETEALDGAGLVEAKYIHGDPKNPDFVVFAAGSYVDIGNFGSSITNSLKSTTGTTGTTDKGSNWKVGAQYNLKMPDGKMTIGLQYEDAEIGTPDRDINPDGGKYIMGSLEFQKGPVAIGGWVATYLSDVQASARYKIYDGSFDSVNDNWNAEKAEWVDEDSISFAIGAKYFFSKRTLLFGGYRQTDSDNNYRDEGVFGVGMRHSF